MVSKATSFLSYGTLEESVIKMSIMALSCHSTCSHRWHRQCCISRHSALRAAVKRVKLGWRRSCKEKGTLLSLAPSPCFPSPLFSHLLLFSLSLSIFLPSPLLQSPPHSLPHPSPPPPLTLPSPLPPPSSPPHPSQCTGSCSVRPEPAATMRGTCKGSAHHIPEPQSPGSDQCGVGTQSCALEREGRREGEREGGK